MLIKANTLGQPSQYLKMGVPALLYTIQVWCQASPYFFMHVHERV